MATSTRPTCPTSTATPPSEYPREAAEVAEVAARPQQPCAWVRCAKGSWRACGVSAAVSDQAWREAAQSFIGNRACMHGRMQVKMRGGQSLSFEFVCAVRGCRCGSDARCARKIHFTTCRVIYFLHDYLSYSTGGRRGRAGPAPGRPARDRPRGPAGVPRPRRDPDRAGSASRLEGSRPEAARALRTRRTAGGRPSGDTAVHTRHRRLSTLLERPPDPYSPP